MNAQLYALPAPEAPPGVDPPLPALFGYAPISLADMGRASLLDRTEVKYLLDEATLAAALAELRDAYAVLSVEGRRISRYRTLYFDTADLAMYRRHHAGALDRYKVRAREYVESQSAFFEVKHKTNKKRTEKQRILTPALVTDLRGGEPAGFVAAASPYRSEELLPRLWNSYRRITLVSLHAQERVTLDLGLRFDWQGRRAALPGVVVAEVKRARLSDDSAFIRLMRAYGIRSTPFSKYCIGVSLLYPEIKHNRFKPLALRVARLMQGESDVRH